MTVIWSDSRDDVDWQELEALYRAAPLGNKNAADLELVFGNSMFCCFARDGGQLVGAGRVLADGRDCAYLCDVAVLPSHQGTGLGKQLIERLLAKSQGHAKIILYAVAGREPLYAKFGFLRMKTAMAIFRNRQSAIDKGLLAES
ncbi:GNAT family N-acetyltransferase [Bradyrhizobium sp. sBnM-33]|uniref:GNAT family N-acetyltransferase n=1 Tax=Bradyrhizobium sp. sBnM-33 TaxID=2831780 RepID=UPI001BCBBBC4|nr:GNAT family N-acetyltransferase [Bradyrhizobium sp. sBnM-33]WOH53029.1 GNAT family N-acetyltransferase [Bradyrhizobium sp. sBnM-33]